MVPGIAVMLHVCTYSQMYTIVLVFALAPDHVRELESDAALHDSEPEVVLAGAHHLGGAVALNADPQRACVQPKLHVLLHFLAVQKHQHLFRQ